MVEDARTNTKTWLETYINHNNIQKEDGQASVIFCFGYPDYPLTRVFDTKGVDVVFSIGDAESTAKIGHDQYAWGYSESVPIEIVCVDKLMFQARS